MGKIILVKEIKPCVNLYRDTVSGIAWIADGTSGCNFSVHANIDKSGSVSGMKKLGYWEKDDRTVKCYGYIYNIDTFICDNNNEMEMIVSSECMCSGCVERRNKIVV